MKPSRTPLTSTALRAAVCAAILFAAALWLGGCSGLPASDPVSETATVVFAAFEGPEEDAPTIGSVAVVIIGGVRALFDGPAATELVIQGVPFGEQNRQPMTVTAPGYLTVSQQLALSTEMATFVDLTMAPVDLTQTGTVAGVVKSTTGLPITSALVTFSWESETGGAEKLEGFTDSEGRFVIGGIPIGTVDVEAIASGYLPVQKTVTIQPDQGGSNADLTFSLLSGETKVTVTGVTLDMRTQEPLAGVAVTVADRPQVITGADGRFSVAEVTVGERTVLASLAGYDPYEIEINVLPGMGNVEVVMSRTSSEPPTTPYTVGGTVTLVGAEDNSGAVVTALDLDEGVEVDRFTTAADGAYRLFLPAGRYEIKVTARGKSLSRTVDYRGGGRIIDGVNFTLTVS